MPAVVAVFVYGTLKRSHLRSGKWPRTPILVSEAVAQADLYDLGPYPGISPGQDYVLGELWIFEPEDLPETLRVLDSVEGYHPTDSESEYVRGTIVVECLNIDGDFVQSTAYTYFLGQTRRLSSTRRIAADNDYHGRKVARWPDDRSRVPSRFEDE